MTEGQPVFGGSCSVRSFGLATSLFLSASGLGTQWSLLQEMPETSQPHLEHIGSEQGCSANVERKPDIVGSLPAPCPSHQEAECDWSPEQLSSPTAPLPLTSPVPAIPAALLLILPQSLCTGTSLCPDCFSTSWPRSTLCASQCQLSAFISLTSLGFMWAGLGSALSHCLLSVRHAGGAQKMLVV